MTAEPARAEWPTFDVSNWKEAQRQVATLKRQLDTLKEALNTQSDILASMGHPGSATTAPVDRNTARYRAAILGYRFSPGRLGLGELGDFDLSTVRAAYGLFRDLYTTLPPEDPNAERPKISEADTIELRDRRQTLAENAALNGLAVAEASKASLLASYDQAQACSAAGRAQTTQRDQINVLIDCLGALLSEQAQGRAVETATLELLAATELRALPHFARQRPNPDVQEIRR